MRTYHVVYIKNNEERIYRVRANSKQEAYNCFKRSANARCEVVGVINHSAEVKETLIASIVAIAILLIIAFSFVAVIASWNDPEPVSYIEYVVEPGDTLWEIARASDMWNKIDASIIIDDIQSASNCTSTIYPGQIVYIPMYED